MTTDNSDQKAALAQAEHDADDRRTSYDGNVANAVADASNQQRAQFEGQMTEAKLAAATMKHAFDQLTTENTELKAAFDSHLAKAEYDAGDMKASIIGVLCTLILHIYLLLPLSLFHFSQVAFDKLTVDNAHQQASAAVAAATAADKQAGFDIRMAKAEHDAGGMKASFPVTMMSLMSPHSKSQIPHSIAHPDPSLNRTYFFSLPISFLIRMPSISSLWTVLTSRPVQ